MIYIKKEEAFTSSEMKVVPVTETKTNWLRVFLGVIIAIAVMMGVVYFFGWFGAGATAPSCGEEVYVKTNDYSDSKVNINYDNDYQIDVSGANGWAVTKVELDVDDDGHSGYWTYATNAVNNFNPSGGEINSARITVYKACPTPTPTPTATPTPTPEPTPPVCDQETWTCGECEEYPNDDWCGEYKYGYCKENYSCRYEDLPNGLAKLENPNWVCDCPVEPTPTPTPQPQEPSKPEGCTHDCGVPACTDTVPEAIVNPHVYRQNGTALVKWYPKQGDKVNIYWRLNSASEWQHAISNSPNDGYEEINGLNGYDWTFGVQSVNGCAADGIVNASTISEVVDGATTGWVLFR